MGQNFISKMLNISKLEEECKFNLTKFFRYLNGLNNILDISAILNGDPVEVGMCARTLLERNLIEHVPVGYLLFLSLYLILSESMGRLEKLLGRKALMEIVAKRTKKVLYQFRPYYLRFYYKKLEFHIPQLDNEILRMKLLREELTPQNIWETMRFTKLFLNKLVEGVEETFGLSRGEVLGETVRRVIGKIDISEENLRVETSLLKYRRFIYQDPWKCRYKI
ncbi:MAG: hypothetical protein ACP6IP_07015 [Candidatus Njordarchaeia archaeon]